MQLNSGTFSWERKSCNRSLEKNIIKICLFAVLLLLIVKVFAWLSTENDVIDPLPEYHSVFCRPRDLKGHMIISALNASQFNDDFDIDPAYSSKMQDAKYDPTQYENCLIPTGRKLAIIIPFRDDGSHARMDQLQVLLHYMIPLLIRQNVKFQFFAITQTPNSIFNRAKLLNIGFVEAMKMGDFDCFFFHDVDLVLENDQAIYHCRKNPLHYSAYINKWNYVSPSQRYKRIYGGVTAFTPESFQAINGYSNEYWGWGAEDDDLYQRMIQKYKLKRPDRGELYRYVAIIHEHETNNLTPTSKKTNIGLYKIGKYRFATDGLNSLHYNRVSIEKTKFYVNITADVLYEDRIPMEKLVPSFFQKIEFYFHGVINGFTDMFDVSDPYGDPGWYKTDLDRIVGES